MRERVRETLRRQVRTECSFYQTLSSEIFAQFIKTYYLSVLFECVVFIKDYLGHSSNHTLYKKKQKKKKKKKKKKLSLTRTHSHSLLSLIHSLTLTLTLTHEASRTKPREASRRLRDLLTKEDSLTKTLHEDDSLTRSRSLIDEDSLMKTHSLSKTHYSRTLTPHTKHTHTHTHTHTHNASHTMGTHLHSECA